MCLFSLLIGVFACFACMKQGAAEYFSSVDSLQTLGKIELVYIDAFRHYLKAKEEEVKKYRRFIEDIRSQHEVAVKDVEDYLGNPINGFTLIKRLVSDWTTLEDELMDNPAQIAYIEELEKLQTSLQLPDEQELVGAVRGLQRLQDAYDIKTSQLVAGEINGVYYGSELSWSDCFTIGTILYDDRKWVSAINWFEETLKKLKQEDDEALALKFQLETYEYMALAYFELEVTEKSIHLLDEILRLKPDHSAKETKAYLLSNAPPKTEVQVDKTRYTWWGNYTRLCRGRQLPEPAHHKLICKLDARKQPLFQLAPLKIEQLSIDPEITLYHSLLTERQTEGILNQVDTMERSKVNAVNGSTVAEVRVSQQTWLNYTSSPVMASVAAIVAAITQLDLGNAETMQVANYGIGGQYEPHHDFFGDGRDLIYWVGDRISTCMFYLADVEQGGYTVFPKLNTFTKPIRGAMVMWYNLHKSLDGDYRTLHAGCPVAKGSKRISNVWIHSGFQEFRRPCELKSDHYKSILYK